MEFPVKSIGIIGGGVVGRAVARTYMEWCDVRVYDIDPARATDTVNSVMLCDLAFVCLPSPATSDGRCDVSVIEGFCSAHKSSRTPLVLRSTVPVGTTRRLAERYKLDICHSPEFLTARCSLVDAMVPSRNVIGYSSDWQASKRGHVVESVYYVRFPGTQLQVMSSDESEAVKLMTNGFFAVKVAFWNEMRAFANKVGLDWETVREAILADGRIHPSHTQVPGPDGKRGFGGSCLPKDLDNLIHCIGDAGANAVVTHAAKMRNQCEDREESPDVRKAQDQA